MKSLLRVFRGESREMLAAVMLGGASLGSAVGLLATSAWLISMASTRPPVLVLEVAIVSVRFFGLSRYFEICQSYPRAQQRSKDSDSVARKDL